MPPHKLPRAPPSRRQLPLDNVLKLSAKVSGAIVRYEFRQSRIRLWRFVVVVLVPLFVVLAGLLVVLVTYVPLKDLLALPVGLLGVGAVGVAALPLLMVWAITDTVIRRGSADIVIDEVGIHHTRLPMTVAWSNIRSVRLVSTVFSKHLRVKVRDLDSALATVPLLLRMGLQNPRAEIDVPLAFFDEPDTIASVSMAIHAASSSTRSPAAFRLASAR